MVLAWDPGVSTGVAALLDDGSVLFTQTLSTAIEVDELARAIEKEYYSTKRKARLPVVIEEPPQSGGHYRPHTRRIESVLIEVFPDARWVRPAEWKGHPAAKAGPSLKGKTQHEKDAACLARWFLLSLRREESK